MSQQTWMKMVKVTQAKQGARPQLTRRTKRPSLELRSVREDHYALLLAARY